MRLPSFVVIGAMKAGSTTLYHDLLSNPAIFLPDKESGCLHQENCRAAYNKTFRRCLPHQISGEISTTYAMLPQSSEVIDRARDTLPKKTKIIYLVRHPVARTLSHHRHMSDWHGPEKMSNDINVEIDRRPELIACSQYAMQLRPWMELFGMENIEVVCFEEYVRDRAKTLVRLSNFIGVPPAIDTIDNAEIHNQSEGKPVMNPFLLRVATSTIYRACLRPFTNQRLRDRIRKLVCPAASSKVVPPNEETLKKICEGVRRDVEELGIMLGRIPFWSIAASDLSKSS